MNSVIIVAAGKGSRMKLSYNKVFHKINGKTILEHTVDKFMIDIINQIIIVTNQENVTLVKEMYKDIDNIHVVSGGAERRDSVNNGLLACNNLTKKVLIHDGARPFVKEEDITRVIEEIKKGIGVTLAIKSVDTLVSVKHGNIHDRIDRDTTLRVQTPQGFIFSEIKYAYLLAQDSSENYTDDTHVYMNAGYRVKTIITTDNLKLTLPQDISFARMKLEGMDMYRVGNGYDVHRLVKDRELILAGVIIPHDKGLLGHSDADVITHAIIDSILGAAGKRDIGYHFSDTDDRYKNISSLILLKEVHKLIKDKYKIVNIDAVIMIEKPKISSYIPYMRSNIASILRIHEDNVNIKATTEEGLGFVGSEEGVKASSICMLKAVE